MIFFNKNRWLSIVGEVGGNGLAVSFQLIVIVPNPKSKTIFLYSSLVSTLVIEHATKLKTKTKNFDSRIRI